MNQLALLGRNTHSRIRSRSEMANSTGVRALRLAGNSANHAKAIIRVFELRRDAGSSRASRHLDLVPPRASARSFSLAILRSSRVPVRRNCIVFGPKPVAAPLVNVLAHFKQAITVRLRVPYWLRTGLPAAVVAEVGIRRVIPPRVQHSLHSASRRSLPFCFCGEAIELARHCGKPRAIRRRIEPRHRHRGLLRMRKVGIAPVWRRLPSGSFQKPGIFRNSDLGCRHGKRIHPDAMNRALHRLTSIGSHCERAAGDQHLRRLNNGRRSINWSHGIEHVHLLVKISAGLLSEIRVQPAPTHHFPDGRSAPSLCRPPAAPALHAVPAA